MCKGFVQGTVWIADGSSALAGNDTPDQGSQPILEADELTDNVPHTDGACAARREGISSAFIHFATLEQLPAKDRSLHPFSILRSYKFRNTLIKLTSGEHHGIFLGIKIGLVGHRRRADDDPFLAIQCSA